MSKSKLSVGIIVGRFQTTALTAGHKHLIDEVYARHSQVVIFIGVRPIILSQKHPLPYLVREQMIKTAYPEATTIPIVDMKEDEKWVATLEKKIHEVVPYGDVKLYGCRDSFLKVYQKYGKHAWEELSSIEGISSTQVRELTAQVPLPTADFRAGVIFAMHNHHPISFSTVDIAIFNKDETEILLGRKHAESQYRLVGGFKDVTDATLEIAAARECGEETELEVDTEDLVYVCSSTVNDWRYAEEKHGITTVCFKTNKFKGTPKAGDDIGEVKWFKFEDLFVNDNNECNPELIVKEHRKLLEKLYERRKTS